jgi:hypothetical protein
MRGEFGRPRDRASVRPRHEQIEGLDRSRRAETIRPSSPGIGRSRSCKRVALVYAARRNR